MIFNIGSDLVSIERIKNILDKNEQHFIKKVLTPTEQDIVLTKKNHSKVNYIAKRFAAKEAIAKAFGEGIGEISFQDITILNYNNGMPYYKLSNKLHEIAKKIISQSNYKIHLTLSDDKGYALAFAVIELL